MKFFLNRQDRLRLLGFDDRWTIILGIPLLGAISFLLISSAEAGMSALNPWYCFLIGLMYTSIYWFSLRFCVIVLRKRFPRQEQTTKRLLMTLLATAGVVLAVELITQPLFALLNPELTPIAWKSKDFGFGVAISATLCLLVCAAYEAVYFFSKYRHSLYEQERLAKANMQAQLTALKQQVNPHFLFNSLNTLTNVIPEDPQLATRFVQRLAAVYRRLLEYRHRDVIPLAEELEALEDYRFLMEARFEDKLSIEVEFVKEGARARAPAFLTSSLPPLVLQLLVENAIQHNVVSNERPLRILVLVEAEWITVTNNLQPKLRKVDSTGLGQRNVRNRYRLLTERAVEIDAGKMEYRVRVPLLPPVQQAHYATA